MADDLAAVIERRKHAPTSTDGPLPRCPECSFVATPKSPNSRSQREHPEDYRCKNGHHFDEPVYEEGTDGE